MVFLYIIQDPKVSRSQFKLGKWVRSQLFDGLCRYSRLILQPRQYSGFDNSLVVHGQRLELPFRVMGEGNLIRHADGNSMAGAACGQYGNP